MNYKSAIPIGVEGWAWGISQHFIQRVISQIGTCGVSRLDPDIQVNQTLIGSTTVSNTTETVYLPTASGPMPVVALINGEPFAVYTDHLNTPRRLTDAQGRPRWQWAYSGFGEQAAQSIPRANLPTIGYSLRYPGQVDDGNGLFYNFNRFYDPLAGRYTNADPIGLEGGWNRFGYVGGNPLGAVDPYGLWEFVFNAGFHLPAFPLFGVSAGPSAGSSWKPGEGLPGATFNGVVGEAILGSIADAGVSAGIGDLSDCKNGTPRSLNFGLGRYGGVQLNFKGTQFDGITIGIGAGVSLPVTLTIPAKN